MKTEKQRVKVLHTITEEAKVWLEAESQSSGRSVSWLIEHAVDMWRKRLEGQRKQRQKRYKGDT